MLGEGPAWDGHTGRLSFVDLLAGRLYAAADTGQVELLAQLEVPLGAAVPTRNAGEYLLIAREGFRLCDADGTVRPMLAVLDDRPDLRFNDAKCDPVGRCLAGTLSVRDEPAQGTLYRLDTGPAVSALVTGVGLANGLGWSPAGTTLYFADTWAGRVDRFGYHLETGTVGTRSAFAELPGPDGLCVDETGAVWVASWDEGEVYRYTPDGRLDTRVELPLSHVTSCAFFGDQLVVTTAAGIGAAEPHAGDLFALTTGTTAPPAVRWTSGSPR